MNTIRYLSRAAVVLACCGTLIPQSALAGTPAAAVAPRAARDIALTANGSLAGAIVNPAGQPLDGAVISLRRNGQEVARGVSNRQGGFEIAGLSSGVYDLAVGQQVTQVRLWTANAAPPVALKQAVIVAGDASRAQYGPSFCGLDIISLTTLTAAVGAVVISGIVLHEVQEIKDKSP
jgi:hypothetical protein